MSTIYQTREHIIERVGPGQGGMSGSGTVIAICDHRNTAKLLVDALAKLQHIRALGCSYYDDRDRIDDILTRAGLI